MKKIYGVLAVSLLLSACGKDDVNKIIDPIVNLTYPDYATASNPKVLADVQGVKVYNGGYGSAMVQDPNDKAIFYLLTDRGPNIDGQVKDSKVFANPAFTPQIGKFRLKDNTLVLESIVELKNKNGVHLNGLPNPDGVGGSGEIALAVDGTPLTPSVDGIDSEGLARGADGSWWVSDEYGPHIIHFDATGREIERLNPWSTGKKLPLVLAKRRPNRGMEGLTLTPDGKTLVGIMQYPLYNPSKDAMKNSLAIRIVTVDLMSGTTKQFVYMMENKDLQAVSEIAAISNSTFIVLERDGEYATAANKVTVFKKIYKIDLADATDISDPNNTANGKLFDGKTVEELKDAATLAKYNIKPVTKTLVVDLMTDVNPLYPHDKAEGLTVINSTLIAVCNDDDFGVTGTGIYASKILPYTSTVDKNSIYFIKLKTALK
ncbi:esterase-like activity of phytase family protein [Sphingobacterium sp. SRCM116780]|uniref:esterase-like activity of phytase family protein n=1 Tax=Sphingobacterium sp. SRCM116780 TaxID=2907623 RepID=UPI001F24CEAA|nr:esterase-like activity of phytase family protein [Sphingobacterium sp. SRCM116780]UIR55216.1 esterase-like activity of phytase family protein [Sphingobacterium sp. SRCM116780]